MNEKVEKLGLEIGKILEDKHPYSRVEVTKDGVKMIYIDSFCPVAK